MIELGVLAVRLLEIAGFNHLMSIAAMTVLTANAFACWLFIARNNHGVRQRR